MYVDRKTDMCVCVCVCARCSVCVYVCVCKSYAQVCTIFPFYIVKALLSFSRQPVVDPRARLFAGPRWSVKNQLIDCKQILGRRQDVFSCSRKWLRKRVRQLRKSVSHFLVLLVLSSYRYLFINVYNIIVHDLFFF